MENEHIREFQQLYSPYCQSEIIEQEAQLLLRKS